MAGTGEPDPDPLLLSPCMQRFGTVQWQLTVGIPPSASALVWRGSQSQSERLAWLLGYIQLGHMSDNDLVLTLSCAFVEAWLPLTFNVARTIRL